MTIAQAIELIIGAGGVGGGVKMIITLTRLAVAVESGAEKLSKVIEHQEQTDKAVADHEIRLSKGNL